MGSPLFCEIIKDLHQCDRKKRKGKMSDATQAVCSHLLLPQCQNKHMHYFLFYYGISQKCIQ